MADQAMREMTADEWAAVIVAELLNETLRSRIKQDTPHD
jgi:hypothetical protein